MSIATLWFQFLIVQLKGPGQEIIRLHRLFQFLIVQLKVIMKKMLLCQVNTFQFLIVQLKASLGLRLFKRTRVSIPYSTIKSVLHQLWNKENYLFQFLIVQLKVENSEPPKAE